MSIINANSGAGTYYGIKQNIKRFGCLAMNAEEGFSFKEEPLEGGFANLVNPKEFQRKWMEQNDNHREDYYFGHSSDVEKEEQRMETYLKMKNASATNARQIYLSYQYGLRNVSEEKEAENKTDIIVKPDGSRVLMITMSVGGMETTMSIEISKPTNMQNDNLKHDNDNDEIPVSESETISNPICFAL